MPSKPPQISVLIPVYNSALYLEKCLSSITQQTFKDFEIIAINDGSKDNSLSILAEFQKKDSRLKVLNQSNQGVAITRNNLLQEATGKYFIFVDSDDWVKNTYFETLFNVAEKARADITKCCFIEFDDNTQTFHEANCTKMFYKEPSKTLVSKFKAGLYDSLLWGKLWRRKFILENKITIPLGFVAEDFPFVSIAFMLSKKTVYLKDILCVYRKNNNSITANSSNMITSVLRNTLFLGQELSRRKLLDAPVSAVLVKEIIWRLCAFRKIPLQMRQENKDLIFLAINTSKEYLKKSDTLNKIRFGIMFLLIKICGQKSLYFWTKIFR